MRRFKNILVATDTRSVDQRIVVKGADIAKHNGAALKIVDVVPEFPWTIRLALNDFDQIRQEIVQEKQDKLDTLATPIRESGIDVETKVLLGRTSVEVIREVLRGKHDLVLGAAKGGDSIRQEFFGNTAIRLLRKCPCAVLLVAPTSTLQFKHVLGCVNTSTRDQHDIELNDKIYELVSSISKYDDGRFSIVHAWSLDGEPMLMERMQRSAFQELRQNSRNQAKRLLDKFLQRHRAAPQASNVHMIKGETSAVISEFVRNKGVDLVVMGTVARAGVAGVIMGNTAEQILNRINCSVLALKPSSFVCPIRLDD